MLEQRDTDHARHLAKESSDTVVFIIRRDTRCEKCQSELFDGSMLTLRDGKGFCLDCAGMADLTFLPSGDPALTRRASKLSTRKAVVVRWARARKRYERQGTLVEEPAIAAAKEQCTADAEERAAKNARATVKRAAEDKVYQAAFLAELKRLFPHCPPEDAADIAAHACEKHSGRVGRSAAAKELDEQMIRLAVIAHIRHAHTGYDHIIDATGKQEARALVQEKIQRTLQKWEA